MKIGSLIMTILWLCVNLTPRVDGRRPGRRKQTAVSPSLTRDTVEWCSTQCELSHCPVVTTDTCGGSIVKDWCNCCPICIGDSPGIDGQPPMIADARPDETRADGVRSDEVTADEATSITDQSEACVKISCAKFQVCMLNIQGIPMCRCPTKFWCMKGERNPVCGQDDVTYKSKCFLKMAECESGQNIPIKHRGKCFKSEKDRQIKLDRQKQKELKTKQKKEKKKIKQDKLARQMKKEAKKEKKQRKKQRRRSKNKRWAQKSRE